MSGAVWWSYARLELWTLGDDRGLWGDSDCWSLLGQNHLVHPQRLGQWDFGGRKRVLK
jgi:hypothetical protein